MVDFDRFVPVLTHDHAQSLNGSRPLYFQVISSTSCSEAFPPDNLSMDAEPSAGWISDEFCSFPQNLLLMFPVAAVLESFQIVVHKHFIPSVVDLFLVQDGFNPGTGVSGADLQKIVGLRFSDVDSETWNNEPLLKNIRFQAPLTARFIQISCQRSQPSPYNLFDQI